VAADEVDDEVGLARAEAGKGRITLAAGRVDVVVAAEPDDARAPHDRLLAGDVAHDLDEPLGVGPAAGVLDAGDERVRVDLGRPHLRLGLGHGYLLRAAGPSRRRPSSCQRAPTCTA